MAIATIRDSRTRKIVRFCIKSNLFQPMFFGWRGKLVVGLAGKVELGNVFHF